MNRLYWYVILSVVWMLLRNDFTFTGLFIGFGLSLIALGLSEKMNPKPFLSFRLKDCLTLSGLFLLSILRANITLARDILRHRQMFTHAFFKIDSRSLSPTQTVLLGNMISLTPGSLTLDTDSNGDNLYVHTLYGQDVDTMRSQINIFLDGLSKLNVSKDPELNEDSQP